MFTWSKNFFSSSCFRNKIARHKKGFKIDNKNLQLSHHNNKTFFFFFSPRKYFDLLIFLWALEASSSLSIFLYFISYTTFPFTLKRRLCLFGKNLPQQFLSSMTSLKKSGFGRTRERKVNVDWHFSWLEIKNLAISPIFFLDVYCFMYRKESEVKPIYFMPHLPRRLPGKHRALLLFLARQIYRRKLFPSFSSGKCHKI